MVGRVKRGFARLVFCLVTGIVFWCRSFFTCQFCPVAGMTAADIEAGRRPIVMTDTKTSSAPLPGAQPDRMFPRLTAEQVARVASHGQARRVETGEVLIEAGEEITHFFVVKT